MSKSHSAWLLTGAAVLVAGVCADAGFAQRPGRLRGRVSIDGSSTVAPITMATSELFREVQPRVQVPVGISGSGGGFKKFLADNPQMRTDINDASRPIKASERERAERLGIQYIEMPIGYDGISIVVNPANDWADSLTVAELKKIWGAGSTIKSWKDVRPGFPDVPLKLFGPGTDSGTFDYFTEAVTGKDGSCRPDFTASEDDNVLVQGVAGEKGALGYFGFAYYEANMDKLKLLAIDGGNGKPIKPSKATIANGTYSPLSRPLFIYVSADARSRPEVQAFLRFFFDNAKRIVEHPRVQYVALAPELYKAVWKRYEDGVTGSVYADPANEGKGVAELFGEKPE
jgi:phosphate transport system substrate-binding protein